MRFGLDVCVRVCVSDARPAQKRPGEEEEEEAAVPSLHGSCCVGLG